MRDIRFVFCAAGMAMLLLFSQAVQQAHAADTGSIRVVFGKASLGLGFGSGTGVLTFHGKDHLFVLSGLSWGATAGVSTNQLVGVVMNLRRLEDFAGVYAATGLGVSAGAGFGRVRLQNSNGVILILQGAKFGIELSAGYADVTITMRSKLDGQKAELP